MSDLPLVLVDGASSGIGKSTVLKLNSKKIKVVGVARRGEKLEQLKKECLYPDLFSYEIKDIGEDVASLPDFVKFLVEKYGRFSGYVHAAGILTVQPLKVLDYEDVIRDFNINLFSSLFIIKELSKKKNQQERLDVV